MQTFRFSDKEINNRLKGKFKINGDTSIITPKILKQLEEFYDWLKGRKVVTLNGIPLKINHKNLLIPYDLKAPIKKDEKEIQFLDLKGRISFSIIEEDDKLIKNQIEGILPILDREKEKQVFEEWREHMLFNLNLKKELDMQKILSEKSRFFALILAIFSSLFLFFAEVVNDFLLTQTSSIIISKIITAIVGGLIIYSIVLLSLRFSNKMETDERIRSLNELNEEMFKSNLNFILLPKNCFLTIIKWKRLPDITLHTLIFEKE